MMRSPGHSIRWVGYKVRKNVVFLSLVNESVTIPMAGAEVTLILLVAVCLSRVSAAGPPIVSVENGALEGTTLLTRRGREIFAFQGIPYAVPPLGGLRFEPPRAAGPWSGVRPAVTEPPKCTQRDVFVHQESVEGQEDCLYLNVYTPRLPGTEEGTESLPVMVWIHGGGWIAGSGSFFGPQFLLDHETILVSFNYRLGALGFLSTGDEAAPGNLGMKDQVLALKWVQGNIQAFGGDPSRVTIFGESAGGASVHYHMMSPLSRGLFHRGISQSGSPLNPWAFGTPRASKEHTQLLARHLDCPEGDSKQLVECLRKKDASEIIEAEKIFQVFGYDPIIPFRITVEPDLPGAFLTDSPLRILERGDSADVPWLAGMTSHEGAIRVAAMFSPKFPEHVRILNENWTEIAPVSLMLDSIFHNHSTVELVDEIREMYFGDKVIDRSSKWTLIDMYSDALVTTGFDAAIRYQLRAGSGPVYYYNFGYEGSSSFSTVFGGSKENYGVCHADELQYLFPVGEKLFPEDSLSENDHKVIDFMTTVWYNFAKTGNPTPKVTESVPTEWTPIESDALEYLSIKDPTSIKMSSRFNEDRIQFWRSRFQQAVKNLSVDQTPAKEEL